MNTPFVLYSDPAFQTPNTEATNDTERRIASVTPAIVKLCASIHRTLPEAAKRITDLGDLLQSCYLHLLTVDDQYRPEICPYLVWTCIVCRRHLVELRERLRIRSVRRRPFNFDVTDEGDGDPGDVAQHTESAAIAAFPWQTDKKQR
jgi:hypothetical protein